MSTPVRALLVSEQRLAVESLSNALREQGGPLDRLVALMEVRTVAEALGRAQTGAFDLAFVDLLSDSARALDLWEQCRGLGESVPLIVLAPDEETGAQCVLGGAYDYLVPATLQPDIARRAVRAAMERRRLERALHTLEHNDSLTGLLNRRGFFAAAEPRLRQAWRGKGTWVLLADVRGLRRINDRMGYSSGNEALLAVAAAIKGSIRGSDLAGRIGGDEFALMLVDSAEDAATAVTNRLLRKVNQFADEKRVPVSLTLGSVRCEPKGNPKLEDVLRAADEELAKARDAAKVSA
jgi:diguanylate cyclase (GGDEF)-like protein